MATGADVRDILELAGADNDSGPISKKDIINSDKVTFLKWFPIPFYYIIQSMYV